MKKRMKILAGLAVMVTAAAMSTNPATAAAPAPSPAGDGQVISPQRPLRAAPLERTVDTTLAADLAAALGTGNGAPGAKATKTLIVYDSTGPYAWLGEVYAMQMANLVSHFNVWTAKPAAGYVAGEIAGYNSLIYIGSTYDEPLPAPFLEDVAATTKPVLWIYDNIWELTARVPTFAATKGFTWTQFDFSAVPRIDYKGTQFTRDTINGSGIMGTTITDPAKTTVVGEAVRSDGTRFPWAVRSGNFTYLGEIPFAYITHDDRYIAFADMLYATLAPATITRHRALVRIEDVGPDADPNELKAVADYLYKQKVPFTVGVYPRYRDPNAIDNDRPADYTLAQRPKVIAALKHMQSRGGVLIMHGYTHQYASRANPYDGVSANDFEFYLAHVDANDRVIYDGPVPEDSTTWFNGRVNASAAEFTKAGFAVPKIFEFPHYAGSAVDYRAVQARFGVRYDRGLYFPGTLTGAPEDYSRLSGQFFPYLVRDVYGSTVLPENVGNYEPFPFNTHPARLPADILASARRNLAVRDGVASFFYHPYNGTQALAQIVTGLKGMGYTFVTADSMVASG